MATPHIAGIVSLMLSYNPDLRSEEIKSLLQNNQSPLQSESSKNIAGGIDFDALIHAVKNPDAPLAPEIIEPELPIQEEVQEESQEEVWEGTQGGWVRQGEEIIFHLI